MEIDAYKLGAWVALHTEGVDRNQKIPEMDVYAASVALHTEGVDRNSYVLLKYKSS